MSVAGWRKSSYSCGAGECLEAGNYRTSSHSSGVGECTEVGSCAHGVAVRDSKLGEGSPVLKISAREWAAFLSSLRSERGR